MIKRNVSKKTLIFIGIIFFYVCSVFSQINPKIYLKLPDLAKLKSRKLLVELIESDKDVLLKLEKKKHKDPDKYQEYVAMIEDYNNFIKSSVKKYWKLNAEFEFIQTIQLNEILSQARARKASEFAVLRLAELSDIDYVFERRSDLGVMVLNYGRAEQLPRKPDYHIYLPNTGLRKTSKWTETDIILAIQILHNHISAIEKKKKVFNFDVFQQESVDENCNELRPGKVLIDSLLIYEKSIADVMEKVEIPNGYEIEITNETNIQMALANNEKNTYIMSCIPFGIMKPTSIMPGMAVSVLITAKLLINAENKLIMNSHEWIKFGGQLGFKKVKPGIQVRNIEGVLKCK